MSAGRKAHWNVLAFEGERTMEFSCLFGRFLTVTNDGPGDVEAVFLPSLTSSKIEPGRSFMSTEPYVTIEIRLVKGSHAKGRLESA